MTTAMRGITESDLEAIRAAALDYVEGWFEGDAVRMERALHPALAKRAVDEDPAARPLAMNDLTAIDMIDATRTGGGRGRGGTYEVAILDAFRNSASVKVVSPPFVDYLHLARFGDAWLIVNVLYDRRGRD